jgi:hypothetical protein
MLFTEKKVKFITNKNLNVNDMIQEPSAVTVL